MSLQTLQDAINKFSEERDWTKHHTPKNLSMSVAIEAAELMEVFQWLTPEDSHRVQTSSDHRESAEDELADVLIYSLRLASILEIDIEEAIKNKLKKNAKKYPSSGHHDWSIT